MSDRLARLSDVLVGYSTGVKPGDVVRIDGAAQPLIASSTARWCGPAATP